MSILFSPHRLPGRPKHDPAVLLGLRPDQMPSFDYGYAERVVQTGAVIFRDGDWHIVAHRTAEQDPILVIDSDGHELRPIPGGDLVAIAIS